MESRVKNYKLKFHQALPLKFFPIEGKRNIKGKPRGLPLK